MDLIFHQLSGLVLGSIPTIVFFLLLVGAYGVLVRRPLDRVLAERTARTTGALDQARGAISAAEAETAVFEDKLRAARSEIFAAREAKLKQLNGERERALIQARASVEQQVAGARESIDRSAALARQAIEAKSGELSAEILRAVMPHEAIETGSAR